MGANGNINDLELQKFMDLAGEMGIRVHVLHGDNWLPSVANLAALPGTGNTTGDVRQALDTGIPYRWNGSAWAVWISGSGVTWGAITGTLSSQTDLQTALNAKMGSGAYVLTSRDSALTNQVNLGALTTGILKQTVSAGISTFTIVTDNSGNWNTAYTHSQVVTGNPHNVTKTEVGLSNVDNTSDANKPVSTAQQTALNLKQDTSGKDATGGYAGLTLFKINFKNVANTFTSFFTNSNTAARTYTFQNRDGTIADDTDLALKAPLASPTFTGTVTVPTPSNGTDAVTKAYADALANGLLDYRGGYDASPNTYPTTGGSGTAGAVVKGDMWIISVTGTLSGTAVQVGDSIIANIDTPGQTQANWNILNSNISYVPEDVANKATTMTGNTASNTLYLTAKAIYDWVTTLLLASLATKTTPVNADGVPIMDSAASNVMKFLSFTNLKAFLKTYFDTIYAQVAGSISQVFSVSSLEVGHATDSSITRVSAGVLAIEGNNIITANITGSTIQAGIAEASIASEVNNGTDAARYVSPDSLAGSNYGTRVVNILVSDPTGSALTTGDGKVLLRITQEFNGFNLIGVTGCVSTVSSSGIPTAMVRRSRRTNATTRADADMLSTALTIDATEFDSQDATTAVVINTSNDDVVTGDHIYIDVDVAGTGTKGLVVALTFQLP